MKRLFGKYVTVERVKEMLSAPPKMGMELSEVKLEFILVAVHGVTLSDSATLLGQVADRASEAGWMVQTYMSNLVLLIAGIPPFTAETQPHAELVASLLTPQIRAVHGVCQSSYGLLGGQTRFAFGAMIPDFLNIVCALATVELGHAKEIAE